MSIARNLRGPN